VDTSGNVIGGDTGVVPIYAPATGGNTGAQDTTGALANTPSGGTNVTEYVILGGLILAVAAGALYMSRDKKQ
jgi:hypothetical protein